MENTIRGEVRQFPYRTAGVNEHILQLPRKLLREFEEALAKKAGTTIDNHTVYEVSGNCFNSDPVYIKFTDDVAIFGRKVEMRHS